MIEVGALVGKLSLVRQYDEAVGKTLGNVELLLVLSGQLYTVPLAVGLGRRTQVNGHVKYGTTHAAYQLALGKPLLIVQTAQHTLNRHGLVVLYKYHIQTLSLKIIIVISLYKITSRITEYGGFDHTQTFDFAASYFNFSHTFLPFEKIAHLRIIFHCIIREGESQPLRGILDIFQRFSAFFVPAYVCFLLFDSQTKPGKHAVYTGPAAHLDSASLHLGCMLRTLSDKMDSRSLSARKKVRSLLTESVPFHYTHKLNIALPIINIVIATLPLSASRYKRLSSTFTRIRSGHRHR